MKGSGKWVAHATENKNKFEGVALHDRLDGIDRGSRSIGPSHHQL